MAGHMLGMTQMVASMVENLRQQYAATRQSKRNGGQMIDALTALQVEKNAGLTTDELVEQMRTVGPRAARGRARTAGLMRHQTMSQDVDGDPEWWTVGYLMDTILTRDPLMHRIDIERATGVLVPPTPDTKGSSSTTWCASGPRATARRTPST